MERRGSSEKDDVPDVAGYTRSEPDAAQVPANGLPKREPDVHYVYAIQCGDSAVKIGRTNDLAERLSTLQIGCPLRLALLLAFRQSAAGAARLEKRMHDSLRGRHIRGEWYRLTVRDMMDWLFRFNCGITLDQAARRVLAKRRGRPRKERSLDGFGYVDDRILRCLEDEVRQFLDASN